MNQNERACLLDARGMVQRMREDLLTAVNLLAGRGVSRVQLVECAWRLDDTIREITNKLKENTNDNHR